MPSQPQSPAGRGAVRIGILDERQREDRARPIYNFRKVADCIVDKI